MKRVKGKENRRKAWHDLHWVGVLCIQRRPLWRHPHTPTLLSKRQSQEGPVAVSSLGGSLGLGAMPSPAPPPGSTPLEALDSVRASTHLPGSPHLESRERVQEAARPLEGGEEQALEADSRKGKRWQVHARKTWWLCPLSWGAQLALGPFPPAQQGETLTTIRFNN